jgi:hypothetical protein
MEAGLFRVSLPTAARRNQTAGGDWVEVTARATIVPVEERATD